MSIGEGVRDDTRHQEEPRAGSGRAQRLNWLRAGVLGANDGIVSVAAVVVGVAGATTSTSAILLAGGAALVGGALSMPEAELQELAGIYETKGLSVGTARQVALELTEHDALAAHLDAELNIDAEDIVSPWGAAVASALSFLVGALLPMLAILLPPEDRRIPVD